jgi:hypothetical protein
VSKTKVAGRFWVAFVFGLALLAIPLPAFSQGCSLCYTQAAAAATRLIQALRSGILVLVIPPMFLSGGITYLAYRKRNQFKDSDPVRRTDQGW